MEFYREIINIDDSHMIEIPEEFRHREVELIVLPTQENSKDDKKGIESFSTFLCKGKKNDFTREDAYAEDI